MSTSYRERRGLDYSGDSRADEAKQNYDQADFGHPEQPPAEHRSEIILEAFRERVEPSMLTQELVEGSSDVENWVRDLSTGEPGDAALAVRFAIEVAAPYAATADHFADRNKNKPGAEAAAFSVVCSVNTGAYVISRGLLEDDLDKVHAGRVMMQSSLEGFVGERQAGFANSRNLPYPPKDGEDRFNMLMGVAGAAAASGGHALNGNLDPDFREDMCRFAMLQSAEAFASEVYDRAMAPPAGGRLNPFNRRRIDPGLQEALEPSVRGSVGDARGGLMGRVVDSAQGAFSGFDQDYFQSISQGRAAGGSTEDFQRLSGSYEEGWRVSGEVDRAATMFNEILCSDSKAVENARALAEAFVSHMDSVPGGRAAIAESFTPNEGFGERGGRAWQSGAREADFALSAATGQLVSDALQCDPSDPGERKQMIDQLAAASLIHDYQGRRGIDTSLIYGSQSA